jgi:hypothetical protein
MIRGRKEKKGLFAIQQITKILINMAPQVNSGSSTYAKNTFSELRYLDIFWARFT